MHCLLCHEKIPRLRVWRTKSEFCCEEHAALYKKQTLERLLVDPNAIQNGGQASLPEPPEPVEFEFDEAGLDAEPFEMLDSEAASEGKVGLEPREQHARKDAIEDLGDDLPELAGLEADEEADELWRLADEVGSDGAGYGRPNAGRAGLTPEVTRQSADEALEALRQLASRASKDDDIEVRPKVFELPGGIGEAAEFRSTDEMFEELERKAMLRDLEGDLGGGLQDDPGVTEPREDLDEDSILERLMADPPRPAQGGAPDFDAFADEAVAASSAIEEAVAEQIPASEAPVDLELGFEAPEPDWDFADASSELSALKHSLQSSGSPPVAYTEPVAENRATGDDASPVEPDWDAFEELDLSDVEVEPPDPELEDEKPRVDLPAAAATAPTADDEPGDEEQAAAPGGDPESPHAHDIPARRTMTSRIRAVVKLFVIEPDMADWEGASTPVKPEAEPDLVEAQAEGCRLPGAPAALGPSGGAISASNSVLASQAAPASSAGGDLDAEQDQLKIVEPSPVELLFPPTLSGMSSRSSGPSMYHGSVDIEPTACLDEDADGDRDATPALLSRMNIPFEPEGLFFDLGGGPARAASEAARDEYEDAEATAGAGRESA